MDLKEDMVAIMVTANTRASGEALAAGHVYDIDERIGEKGSKILSREDAIKLIGCQKAQAIDADNLDTVKKEGAKALEKAQAAERKANDDSARHGSGGIIPVAMDGKTSANLAKKAEAEQKTAEANAEAAASEARTAEANLEIAKLEAAKGGK